MSKEPAKVSKAKKKAASGTGMAEVHLMGGTRASLLVLKMPWRLTK